MNKKGPGTSPIAESGGFLYTRQGLSAPDVQLHFLPVMVVDHGRTEMRKDGYSLHVCTLRPESRGTIRLKSKDPKEHPLIDANYLAERRDLDTLIDGVKMGRDIFAQAGFDPYRAEEFQPGAGGQDRRRDRAVDPRQVRDDLSPGRHLQDGAGQRSHGGGRQSLPRPWPGRACAWSTPR